MCVLISPANNAVIDLYTAVQAEFIEKIEKQGIAAALDWLLPIKCESELTYPVAVEFSWEPDASSAYVFELAQNEAFCAPFVTKTKEPHFTLTNLEVGKKYYWRINGGNHHVFETVKRQYRFIKIDGALNVRDLGGIRIKQGLIYRGSEINREYKITEDGIRAWKQLGIKTEINLRKDAGSEFATSCIGPDVGYKYLPYRPYSEVFEEMHRKELVDIMECLADANNYPIYFHCLGGADRTGMIALFLRGLLGENEESILTDYELTSLSSYAYGKAEGVSALGFRSRYTEYFQRFYDRFKACPGNTLQEKTTAFLLECGVLPQTISKIKHILAQ